MLTACIRDSRSSGEKYSVEALLAMILAEARRLTEAYAEQTVKDAVITVPAYFNQAERRAVEDAARIAGINLLQVPRSSLPVQAPCSC